MPECNILPTDLGTAARAISGLDKSATRAMRWPGDTVSPTSTSRDSTTPENGEREIADPSS
jgi:hypothetical protein